MKITVLMPQSDFSKNQVQQLSLAGEVEFLESPVKRPIEELAKFASNADIIGIDPDNFGGFEGAKEKITQLLKLLPKVKAITLSTTSFGWIDLNYCKKRNITVSNIPGYSRESVAEHVLALLLCLAKRIIISDRQNQKNQYKLEKGIELKGKTLGIIGLGNIGSRVAELGNCIGMKVIAYNHSPKAQTGVEMKSLDEVLKESDVISINVTSTDKNKNLINENELRKVKKGIFIVNLADRENVNEQCLSAISC